MCGTNLQNQQTVHNQEAYEGARHADKVKGTVKIKTDGISLVLRTS
jgi:hypothetical protein